MKYRMYCLEHRVLVSQTMQKDITTITYGVWLIEPGGFVTRLVRGVKEELRPKA